MYAHSDFADMILTIDNTKAGTTIPVNEYGAGVVHHGNRSTVTGLQLRVGIVHVDQLHPCALGVTFPQLLHDVSASP